MRKAKTKHELTRYPLIERGMEKIGIRLWRLEDGSASQKPADQYGFVLGKNRIDAGRMVLVETKEVHFIKECASMSTPLWNMLSAYQALSLGIAAQNNVHALFAAYCQEDCKLRIWSRGTNTFRVGLPPFTICDKLTDTDGKQYFEMKLKDFNTVGIAVEWVDELKKEESK